MTPMRWIGGSGFESRIKAEPIRLPGSAVFDNEDIAGFHIGICQMFIVFTNFLARSDGEGEPADVVSIVFGGGRPKGMRNEHRAARRKCSKNVGVGLMHIRHACLPKLEKAMR